MCMNESVPCSCGRHRANIMFRDNIVPMDAIRQVLCPECEKPAVADPYTMIQDNGWIVELDMDRVERSLIRCNRMLSEWTADCVFEEDYVTWNGFTPTELEDSLESREAVIRIANVDFIRYLKEMREWALARVHHLAEAGWRKALKAV